jgi:hypothetical protein
MSDAVSRWNDAQARLKQKGSQFATGQMDEPGAVQLLHGPGKLLN